MTDKETLLAAVIEEIQLAALIRAARENDPLLANATNTKIAFCLGLVLTAQHSKYTQVLLRDLATNVEAHRSLMKIADALPKLHPAEAVVQEEPV